MADCTCDGDRVSYPVVPGEDGWDKDCVRHGVRALLMTPMTPEDAAALPARIAAMQRLANQRQSVTLTVWFEPGTAPDELEDLTDAAVETLARFRQVSAVTVIEETDGRVDHGV